MPPKKRKNRRQFGAIRKLPSGRWQARYPGPDGVIRPADHTFPTAADAGLWLDTKRAEIADGRWLDPDAGRITVGEWADRWLLSVRPGLQPSTYALYAGLIRSRIKPVLGDVTVADLRPIMVAEWVAGMRSAGLSASRIRHAYIVLNQMMAAAVNNELRASSPCRGVKLPRITQAEPSILTPEQVERLLAELTGQGRVLVMLLAYAGLRLGEAFALRRSAVDLAGQRVHVVASVTEIAGKQVFGLPKSHQTREVSIPPSLVVALRSVIADLSAGGDPLVFVGNRLGRPLRYDWWRDQVFDPAAERAGLSQITPKDLRATHATWVADRLGVMVAAKRLGHSNASVTTRHYARAVESRQDEAAAVLDVLRDQAITARGRHDEGDDGAAGVLVPS